MLSIITINYNNDKGLKNTIQSVIAQRNRNFEFIVIDGGSTDNSKIIINQNSEFITYWVSEKDEGIYHAMNKGIMKAKGKYILFLNSGDELIDEYAFNNINFFGKDIIYFDVLFHNQTSSFVHQYPINLNFNYFLKYSLPHQATLIKRILFTKVGMYNEGYKICSDWAFFVDAICKYGATYKKISKVLAKLDRTGISCDPQNADWIQEERLSFLQKYYSHNKLIYETENLPVKTKITKLLDYFFCVLKITKVHSWK